MQINLVVNGEQETDFAFVVDPEACGNAGYCALRVDHSNTTVMP